MIKRFIANVFPILKVFSAEKLVKSYFFNSMGLQVFRMKLAQKIYESKNTIVPNSITDDYKRVLFDGVLQVDNFLDDSDIKNIKKECEQILEEGEYKKFGRRDGPNTIYMLDIFSLELRKYPAIEKLLNNQYLNQMFSALEKRKISIAKKDIIVQFQYLVQGEDNGSLDPETELHSDTFFNTHKAWLYLDNVGYDNGPFVFVKKSQNINLPNRLKREKEFSMNLESKGSRRVNEEEVKELGLYEEPFLCSENTLVIANTLGYHRRLRGKAGSDRLTIAFSARSNPFLKF